MINFHASARDIFFLLFVSFPLSGPMAKTTAAELRGEIVDAISGERIAARLYIKSESGSGNKGTAEQGPWFFARSASSDGSAVTYRTQRREYRGPDDALAGSLYFGFAGGLLYADRRMRKGIPTGQGLGRNRRATRFGFIAAAAMDRHECPRMVFG